MNLRRIVGFLVLALVIFFIITQPETAADSVQTIGATLRDAADSITTFFTELV
jgi:large-conductance mechanosensitive channel